MPSNGWHPSVATDALDSAWQRKRALESVNRPAKRPNGRSKVREYAEAVALIAGLTAIAWQLPFEYRAFSHIYLLGVVALSLRVGRGPVLVAAILSAVAWDFFGSPPRLSFRIVNTDHI